MSAKRATTQGNSGTEYGKREVHVVYIRSSADNKFSVALHGKASSNASMKVSASVKIRKRHTAPKPRGGIERSER